MENLLWDHVRRHPEIDDRLVRCANALKAASPEVTVDDPPPYDVLQSEPVRPTLDTGRLPSPAICGWQSIKDYVESILDSTGIFVNSNSKTEF